MIMGTRAKRKLARTQLRESSLQHHHFSNELSFFLEQSSQPYLQTKELGKSWNLLGRTSAIPRLASVNPQLCQLPQGGTLHISHICRASELIQCGCIVDVFDHWTKLRSLFWSVSTPKFAPNRLSDSLVRQLVATDSPAFNRSCLNPSSMWRTSFRCMSINTGIHSKPAISHRVEVDACFRPSVRGFAKEQVNCELVSVAFSQALSSSFPPNSPCYTNLQLCPATKLCFTTGRTSFGTPRSSCFKERDLLFLCPSQTILLDLRLIKALHFQQLWWILAPPLFFLMHSSLIFKLPLGSNHGWPQGLLTWSSHVSSMRQNQIRALYFLPRIKSLEPQPKLWLSLNSSVWQLHQRFVSLSLLFAVKVTTGKSGFLSEAQTKKL